MATEKSTKKAPKSDEIGYEAALAELEEILEDIEGTDVDVDVLAERVKRAAELVKVCRDRIAAAKLHVEQVVADVEDE
jgi:exodeoxyribonuclease VII small subunit